MTNTRPDLYHISTETAKAHIDCCADLDEDCEKVDDKLACARYDPSKGICPFVGD